MGIFNFKKAARRIFLINFEGMQVFTLDEKRLIREGMFQDSESGYRQFRQFLAERPIAPVTLVVDSPAEDFIVEKVAHVGPFDRAALLERKLEHHFRGYEYRSAKILGRDAGGRRDDRVLFSAITKEQMIEPWIKILLQEEFPIKSITSPAFAICKVANELGLDTEKQTLLVNWQRSGIRQSYIVGEKLMFSRLTPLPTDPDANLAKVIIDACSQSKDYLERIGLIKFNDKLEVHVITPILEDDAFLSVPGMRNFTTITHHNSIDLMPIDKYGGPQDNITALLLCLDWGVREGEFGNIYASHSVMRFLRLYKTRTIITASGLGAIVLSAVLTVPTFLDGINRRANYTVLTTGLLPLQAEYDELRAAFPETPIPSAAMELAVRMYDTIERQMHDPTEILVPISQVLARYPAIEVSTIDWVMQQVDPDLTFAETIIAEDTEISLELSGSLVGSSSFQNSENLLRAFIASLNQIEGISATALRMPVEAGPYSALNTSINSEVQDAQFTIRLGIGS